MMNLGSALIYQSPKKYFSDEPQELPSGQHRFARIGQGQEFSSAREQP
jgi:hypothetical protein